MDPRDFERLNEAERVPCLLLDAKWTGVGDAACEAPAVVTNQAELLG